MPRSRRTSRSTRSTSRSDSAKKPTAGKQLTTERASGKGDWPTPTQGQGESSIAVDSNALRRLVTGVFERLDLAPDDAAVAADILVEADLRGIESHGVSNYLKLLYVPGLQSGRIQGRPELTTAHETPVSARLDGGKGLGLVVGYHAMRRAMAKARDGFLGFVTVCNSGHYGIAGYYASMALEEGMIGISMTNADPLVLPTFGKEARLGTNPISVAVPTAERPPYILDMATSTVALGKILNLLRDGTPLPQGWAADDEGIETHDASVAWDAKRLLPLGGQREHSGHKGYGLAMLVDIFTALLAGGVPSYDVHLTQPVSHFFAALRIDAFRDPDEFRADMDAFLDRLCATPRVAGEERIFYPGLIEHETKQQRLQDGIPLHPQVVRDLQGIADELQVDVQLS